MWDELDRRGPRFRADHRLDVARVPTVLLTVGGVDRFADVLVGVDEGDVPIDAPGADASVVTVPGAAVRAAGATAPGLHVEVVAARTTRIATKGAACLCLSTCVPPRRSLL